MEVKAYIPQKAHNLNVQITFYKRNTPMLPGRSFLLLPDIPLCEYTFHFSLLLLMGIWIASSLGLLHMSFDEYVDFSWVYT